MVSDRGLDCLSTSHKRDDGIVGFCGCSMFCCGLLCDHSSFAIILIGKRELIALRCLSFWCLVIVVLLFLTMPQVCLHFVIMVFPNHTHFLLSYQLNAVNFIS